MTIYKRIKALREQQGMSQQALAEKVGYKTASAVNKIELGLRDINQNKIIAFANALNTTPAYLMGWEEPTNKNETTTVTAEDLAEINELYEIYSSLPEEQQQIVTDLIRSLSKNHSDNNTTDNK